MKRRKYLLVPGWIRSRTDGNWHYIGCGKLIELYGVKKHECVISITGTNEDIRALANQGQLKPLRPRADGNYSLNWSESHEQQKRIGI